MSDIDTHILRVEEAIAEYAEAVRAYRQWMEYWRARQRQHDVDDHDEGIGL